LSSAEFHGNYTDIQTYIKSVHVPAGDFGLTKEASNITTHGGSHEMAAAGPMSATNAKFMKGVLQN
jgi:hypothetical protein